MTTTKRRARRIAADEAHAWARNLKLGNIHAKLILSMLTLYVDSEGKAFVSIPELGKDCELSPDTVRRRLGWLEEIGAISRLPQWLDEKGNRNSDGRGKRTTDLIQLLYESDQDAIEDRAAGNVSETPTKSTLISPSQQPGLNSNQDSVSPAPGLGQPSHCGEGLISEPEPEPDSPKAPEGGASEGADADEVEPEEFAAAWSAWPDHELQGHHRSKAVEAFRKLTPDKRRHCRAAIPLFVQMHKRAGRNHAPNFHLWIRNGGFEEFPAAAVGDATAVASTSHAVDSAEGKAIKALFAFGGALVFEYQGVLRYPLAVTPQVMAFGSLPERPAWHWIEGNQLAAWSAFLSSHIHVGRKEITTTRGEGEAKRRGMYAPWSWPPRKDGTISETGGESAA